MGATTFLITSCGKDAKEAFHRAVEEAAYEHGHGGYTGTIAEKGSFKVFETPKGMTALEFAKAIEDADFEEHQYVTPGTEKFVAPKVPEGSSYTIKNAAKVFDDKWGPAVCIPLNEKETLEETKRYSNKPQKGEKMFIFCGWASC